MKFWKNWNQSVVKAHQKSARTPMSSGISAETSSNTTAGNDSISSSRAPFQNSTKTEFTPPSSKADNTTTTPGTTATTDSLECFSQWTDESVAQVAEWWNLSDKDITRLWQLHDRLQDVSHWKNQPNEVVRYLRDAHGHVSKAEHKFRRMVQWRLEERIDDLVADYVPPHPLFSHYLPTTVLDAYDKQGDPIWLERVGAADSFGLLQTFGHDEMLRYAVYVRENCIRGPWAQEYLERQNGRPPMRATAIVDLHGMTWDHLKPSLLPLLKDALHIIQAYYVGFGKKVIVIRTSKLFPIVWKVAQHFCGENLRNMMVFASYDNYLQVLEEYVDLENLPPCIYPQGHGRGGVGMPQNLEGGKVPPRDELDALWAKRKDITAPASWASSASLSNDSHVSEHVPRVVNKDIPVSMSALSDDESFNKLSQSADGSVSVSSPSSSAAEPFSTKVGVVVSRLGGGFYDFSSSPNEKIVQMVPTMPQ